VVDLKVVLGSCSHSVTQGDKVMKRGLLKYESFYFNYRTSKLKKEVLYNSYLIQILNEYSSFITVINLFKLDLMNGKFQLIRRIALYSVRNL